VSIEGRLAKLEAKAHASPARPSYGEVVAARERITASVRATLAALIARQTPTMEQEAMRREAMRRDRAILERYYGPRGVASHNARERLAAMLDRVAASGPDAARDVVEVLERASSGRLWKP
jgi:hypothetical protein